MEIPFYTFRPGFCYNCKETREVRHYEHTGQYECYDCGSFETRLVDYSMYIDFKHYVKGIPE